MTFETASSIFAEPIHIWLEISSQSHDQAWQQSQSFSTPSSRWNAYLNQLCLRTILPWLQEEFEPQAKAWPSATGLASCWEFVNGTAIKLDKMRMVLVPSETIDTSELRIAQEWVDIPGWAADYYLAVQVNPDDGWIRIWGYCTHQQLKARGSYDVGDRTYSLEEDDIIKDINVLWVARQLCPEEPTMGLVPSLPALPLTQAENLLPRLGNSAVLTPRMAVPFQIWGAILEHGGWRQRLYDLRLGRQEQWSILQWLNTGVSEVAQQLGWGRSELQPSMVGARSIEQEATISPAFLSRQLPIADQFYELRVIPQGLPEERIWRFELRNTASGRRIPSGFKLRLLTEDLQPFENNEATSRSPVEQLFVVVALESGEGIVWEIEPIPENYEPEILRF